MKLIYILCAVSAFSFLQCSTPSKNKSQGAASKNQLSTELFETYWKLIELNGQPVTNPGQSQKEAYIILKKDDLRLQGSGGCNSLMGSYQLAEGNRITFSNVASTLMACPDMATEDELKRVIATTDNYAINGKYLMLHKAKMAPLARFEAQ